MLPNSSTCNDIFEETCSYINRTPNEVLHIFRTIGPKLLKPEYRAAWSYDKPTTGYCYIASEMVYWYHLKELREHRWGDHWPKRRDASRVDVLHMRIPSKNVVHWCLSYHSIAGFSVTFDLTANQFDDYAEYVQALTDSKRGFFFQSHQPGPSKRAKILAEAFGYKPDDDWIIRS